jgi:hypothetical protein
MAGQNTAPVTLAEELVYDPERLMSGDGNGVKLNEVIEDA